MSARFFILLLFSGVVLLTAYWATRKHVSAPGPHEPRDGFQEFNSMAFRESETEGTDNARYRMRNSVLKKVEPGTGYAELEGFLGSPSNRYVGEDVPKHLDAIFPNNVDKHTGARSLLYYVIGTVSNPPGGQFTISLTFVMDKDNRVLFGYEDPPLEHSGDG